MLNLSRYLALFFAIGLGLGEAVINWGNWQFAPLWIVDYLIVVWLLVGFRLTRNGRSLPVLMSGWAFTAGVFYMALFISLDPQLNLKSDRGLLSLIALMLLLAVGGFVSAALAQRKMR